MQCAKILLSIMINNDCKSLSVTITNNDCYATNNNHNTRNLKIFITDDLCNQIHNNNIQ